MKPKRQIYREGANGEKGIIFVSFTLLLMVLIVGVGAVYAFAFADYRASLRNDRTRGSTAPNLARLPLSFHPLAYRPPLP